MFANHLRWLIILGDLYRAQKICIAEMRMIKIDKLKVFFEKVKLTP